MLQTSQPLPCIGQDLNKISSYLFENFKGYQECFGIKAPPKDSVIVIVEPITTSSHLDQTPSGRKVEHAIAPGTYKIIDGFPFNNRYFLLELADENGEAVIVNLGSAQSTILVDWRLVQPAK